MIFSLSVFIEELDGGGGSVRRRNTLHVVGGGQFYCHKRGLRGERIFYKIFYFIK
jgi:hypothetical protein